MVWKSNKKSTAEHVLVSKDIKNWHFRKSNS